MKKLVLTGGGTAGHVTPHLALLKRLQESGYEIHYIGTRDGIEHDLMREREGVIYHAISSGKLRRYLSFRNLTDPFRVLAGFFQSYKILRGIRPGLVFSKGGFVAVPVVAAAFLLGIPVLAHESDLTPGLANRISALFAKKVATTFPQCAAVIGRKGVHTGTPMRGELFEGSREKGLKYAGFDGQKPVLLMMGGSQGAQAVNEALRSALPDILPKMDVLHLCGKGKLDETLRGKKGYFQAEYVDKDLCDVLAASDLVLSRSGATAISEFLALKKPMLLVPYPKGASRGDQILNAQDFEKRGLALTLMQENMTGETLRDKLFELMDRKDELRANQMKEPNADGSGAVLSLIGQLFQKKEKDI